MIDWLRYFFTNLDEQDIAILFVVGVFAAAVTAAWVCF